MFLLCFIIYRITIYYETITLEKEKEKWGKTRTKINANGMKYDTLPKLCHGVIKQI